MIDDGFKVRLLANVHDREKNGLVKNENMSEKELRVFEVSQEILKGRTHQRELLPWIAQNWGIHERQGKNYIREARELIAQAKYDNLEEMKSLTLARLEFLIHENYVKGDFRECRQLIMNQADILGLVKSRFADKQPEAAPAIRIVSRFQEKWDKAEGNG